MKHFTLQPFSEYKDCSLIAYLHEYSEEIKISVRRTVVICPGGGYSFLSYRESDPIAVKFYAQGFNVFVLNYSINENASNKRPLIEACKTVKYLREHAEEYGIDSRYIFINGYSAGGHLAASCGTMFDLPEIRSAVGCVDNDLHKPTGMILGYPVLESGKYAHVGSFDMLCGSKNATLEERAYYSVDKHVNKNTAPAFIWHTFEDEAVPVQNSLIFSKQLADNGVCFEMHIYPHGPHGLALCNEETALGRPHYIRPECEGWIIDACRWMNSF